MNLFGTAIARRLKPSRATAVRYDRACCATAPVLNSLAELEFSSARQ